MHFIKMFERCFGERGAYLGHYQRGKIRHSLEEHYVIPIQLPSSDIWTRRSTEKHEINRKDHPSAGDKSQMWLPVFLDLCNNSCFSKMFFFTELMTFGRHKNAENVSPISSASQTVCLTQLPCYWTLSPRTTGTATRNLSLLFTAKW